MFSRGQPIAANNSLLRPDWIFPTCHPFLTPDSCLCLWLIAFLSALRQRDSGKGFATLQYLIESYIAAFVAVGGILYSTVMPAKIMVLWKAVPTLGDFCVADSFYDRSAWSYPRSNVLVRASNHDHTYLGKPGHI